MNGEGTPDQKDLVIRQLKQQLEEIKEGHRQELESLQMSYEENLRKKNEIYDEGMMEFEKNLQKVVKKEQEKFYSSWSWRIGRFPVVTVILVRNFFFNPIKFLFNKQYRVKDIFYFPPDRKTSGSLFDNADDGGYPAGKEDFEIDPSKAVIGCIFDTFTYINFKPEFNIISPSPENWKALINKYSLQAFFTESAWHGNQNSWENLVEKKNDQNLNVLSELLVGCREKNIPTIFWNKEDPVHFDRFLEASGRFDYIFTTDEDCIPRYKANTGHDRVYPLPFAAQPEIHNPILEHERNGSVCFAGTYYNTQFAGRKNDIDIILRPALSFGLDIYDRKFGVTGKLAEIYQFPGIYHSSIKGKLDYNDMIVAYKRYKVFLNVNSVKYSPTMFARRVFELLACGTPVISSYSKGIINILGEDTVLISESEEETKRHLENLLGDQNYWWKKSLQGMRKVMEAHTCFHRVKYIFDRVGLAVHERKDISFIVTAKISSPQDAELLHKMLKSQIYQKFEVLLIIKGLDTLSDGEVETMHNLFPLSWKVVITPADPDLKADVLFSSFASEYVAIFDTRNHYGKNYLRDYSLAITYSGAKLLGKKTWFSEDPAGQLRSNNDGFSFRYVTDVPTDTLVVKKDHLLKMNFLALFEQNTLSENDKSILSIDPYNFVKPEQKFLRIPYDKIIEKIDI